jgi:hypothetical protein
MRTYIHKFFNLNQQARLSTNVHTYVHTYVGYLTKMFNSKYLDRNGIDYVEVSISSSTWKMLVYFMAIWYILWLYGIFYGHLVYFMAIWYILWLFGIFFGHLVYFMVFYVGSIFVEIRCFSH